MGPMGKPFVRWDRRFADGETTTTAAIYWGHTNDFEYWTRGQMCALKIGFFVVRRSRGRRRGKPFCHFQTHIFSNFPAAERHHEALTIAHVENHILLLRPYLGRHSQNSDFGQPPSKQVW